jgi:hypothetical protein
MPSTRRQTLEHSRRLRSRNIPLEQSYEERRKRARRLPSQKHTIHANGRTGRKKLQDTRNNKYVSFVHRLTRPLTLNLSRESDLNPEDIGVPKDGNWDHIAAHERRFCIDHEEDEWLLQSVNRWMYASNFDISKAETVLEAKLQEYNKSAWDLKAHLPTSRAECYGDLLSHIDTPIKKQEFEGKLVYLIRWKYCWTPQSHINDMSWVQSTFNAQNEQIGRRCSKRIRETTEEQAKKREAMMVVVNIEDWL